MGKYTDRWEIVLQAIAENVTLEIEFINHTIDKNKKVIQTKSYGYYIFTGTGFHKASKVITKSEHYDYRGLICIEGCYQPGKPDLMPERACAYEVRTIPRSFIPTEKEIEIYEKTRGVSERLQKEREK